MFWRFGADLIIAEADAGPVEAVDVLRAASVGFVTMPDDPTPEGLISRITAVSGGLLPVGIASVIGLHLVPFAAFPGNWGATILLYAVSSRQGRTSAATLLLAGLALGARAGAATGILIYVADDRQLRDLTFWGIGKPAGILTDALLPRAYGCALRVNTPPENGTYVLPHSATAA